MILNPKASSEQKVAAVGKVAEVTATETVKSTIRKVATEKNIKKAKEAVKKGGAALLPYAGPVGAAVAGGAVVSKLQKGRVSKQAKRMLDDTIKRTPKGQRAQYTPAVRAQLLAQYESHIRRQNEILFTK